MKRKKSLSRTVLAGTGAIFFSTDIINAAFLKENYSLYDVK